MIRRTVRGESSGQWGRGASALALVLVCTTAGCSRLSSVLGMGGDSAESLELAGLRIGMTADEVEQACGKRSTKQIIRRVYGGFDAQGRLLRSSATPTPAAPGEQRFLTHMTCGSSAGLSDVSFAPEGEARAVVIRHDDNVGGKSVEETLKAPTDSFGEPSKRGMDKIAHSGLDKLSLEWVVPKGARDCRELFAKAADPGLDVPEDCGYTYAVEIFSKRGAVTLTKSSLSNLGGLLRSHQSALARHSAKQERR